MPAKRMSPVQLSFLEPPPLAAPAGFLYREELVPPAEEAALLDAFARLPFREFEFCGYLGKRRTVSYGLHYDFADGEVHRTGPIPDFLLALRDRAAVFAGLAAEALEHALVTEYTLGAAIGWHRDRPVFGDVIGISFASACRFRFRQKRPGGWERLTVALAPRSAYLLRGAARSEWEHSIPPAEELRYSVTFRTLRVS
jgi:alkylated DNA repair dioxygenase AlkB